MLSEQECREECVWSSQEGWDFFPDGRDAMPFPCRGCEDGIRRTVMAGHRFTSEEDSFLGTIVVWSGGCTGSEVLFHELEGRYAGCPGERVPDHRFGQAAEFSSRAEAIKAVRWLNANAMPKVPYQILLSKVSPEQRAAWGWEVL